MNHRCLILFLVLSLLFAGCGTDTPVSSPTETYGDPFWNHLELTEVFLANIHEDSSLEEMMEAFVLCCQASTETVGDEYVYSVHTYEFEGQQFLHLMVVRQFMVNNFAFCLEIGFGVDYLLDEEIMSLQEDHTVEGDWMEFVEYVKASEAWQKLLPRDIHSRGYDISCW